ncbi:hypothetical protein QFZ75_001847 [Streptomyces sp. V3I8]|uniref:protein phosphatase 2C domain-containing protein n=1 Tax=Streptomyces sp. V3I8 TaxID=3042279 RepID=UPI00278448EC|nr:protein phosphatase 2C domain-containing protein [Streptomyces sp. V3I8]MDQ1035431.1 hypothetical protein [Streptomyces sp. V3I8]
MSQQGERPTGHQDDWWGQLYDDSTGDTGPAPAPDSLDDRFVSATHTLDTPQDPTTVPPPRQVRDQPSRPARDVHPAGSPAPEPGSGSGSRQGRGELRGQPPRPAPDVHPPGPPSDLPPWWPPTGPPPTAVPPQPRAADPRGPAPADPPSDPLRRSGLQRQRAPWEPPLPGPPADTTLTDRPAAGPAAGLAISPADGPAQDGPAQDGPAQDGPRVPTPLDHVGSGPPTYAPEPTALPPADPDALDDLVADTVLDGASYGTSTLRAVSVRGDSARYRGEPRRDSLLTARFGSGDTALVLVAMATGARATPDAHRAAAEACRWIGRAVGRSHARLAEDIRAARRGDLKSGLHRLTDRSLGRLRAGAAEQGVEPEEYTASLRCLLLPADPECRTRVFFGVGAGGLFRLRDGEWQDIEPRVAETTGEAVVGFGSLPHETPDGDRLTMDLNITTPPSPYEPAPEPSPRDPFRFRASVARPGDALLLCSSGLAEPLRGEPRLVEHLTARWSAGPAGGPPGLAAFLADTTVRVKGYADDRTAAVVWEA